MRRRRLVGARTWSHPQVITEVVDDGVNKLVRVSGLACGHLNLSLELWDTVVEDVNRLVGELGAEQTK